MKKNTNKHSNERKKGKRIFGARKEKNYLIENLSVLLASGMDMSSALKAIRDEIHSKVIKEAVSKMTEDIIAGSPIWKAIQRARMFPEHIISLIKLGEQSGKLSENLLVVVNEREKDRVFRSRIQSGMLYPAFVLILAIVFGVVIAWVILPRLSTLFLQMNVELPIFTRMLIAIGDFLKAYGIIAVPLFFGLLILGVYAMFFRSKTKHIGQAVLFVFPGVQKLMVQIGLSRMGYILGTLLHAGLPIVDALNALEETTTIAKYKQWYSILSRGIENGYSFENIFRKNAKIRQVIPIPIQQMIMAGEQSGNLPETFLKIGEIYDDKTEVTTKNLTIVLEPILLVFVWFSVLFVAVSIIMPIYGLVGSINDETSINSKPEAQLEDATPLVSPEPITSEARMQSRTSENQEVLTSQKRQEDTLTVVETYANGVNIRNNPSLAGTVISKAKPGTTYVYLAFENGWYEIILPDEENIEVVTVGEQTDENELLEIEPKQTGWIFEKYVVVEKN